MSVSDKVLNLLKSKEWVSNNELEDLFPKGAKGHYSWSQRLRGLREQGYIVKRRIKSGTHNLSEWHLEEQAPLFAGAGTTGVVAKKNNRNFIGIELNPKYVEMAQQRIDNTQESLF